jgi:hypothetical protein
MHGTSGRLHEGLPRPLREEQGKTRSFQVDGNFIQGYHDAPQTDTNASYRRATVDTAITHWPVTNVGERACPDAARPWAKWAGRKFDGFNSPAHVE